MYSKLKRSNVFVTLIKSMSKNLKNKILKFSFLVLILAFLFQVVKTTYAKYIKYKEFGSNIHIAQWNIAINNENISENESFNELIEIVPELSEHIAENVIVPTSKGYFIVNLESTGTEVPFEYKFSLSNSESAVSDFRITSYLLYDGTDYNEVLTEDELDELKAMTTFVNLGPTDTEISGTVLPESDISKKVVNSFLIYFEWYDKEDNLLDNKNDTITSLTANSSDPKKDRYY